MERLACCSTCPLCHGRLDGADVTRQNKRLVAVLFLLTEPGISGTLKEKQTTQVRESII